MKNLVIFILAIMLLPISAFAFEIGDLMDPAMWAPYAAILLAISEFLSMTDMVKANGILSWIIEVIMKALRGLK